ncbi:MAG: WhiB family transcriptional regulator [Pseudonocardia sp.]
MTAAASSKAWSSTRTAGRPGTRATWREPVESHVSPGEWRHRAACRSVDPDVFFPVPVAGLAFRTRVAVAKAVCGGCPVREACLDWALAHQPDGIAGGMTEQERCTERGRRSRARRRARMATAGGGEGESASAATVALSRVSHNNGLAGHTSSGRTPRVDDDPGA